LRDTYTRHKKKQLAIILANNPMKDDIHVGIRTLEDIKTAQEALSVNYNPTPDWNLKDIKQALNTGKVTVYSSKRIKPGVFVTPSEIIARGYGSEVHRMNVSIDDIAWIDEFEGQYAPLK